MKKKNTIVVLCVVCVIALAYCVHSHYYNTTKEEAVTWRGLPGGYHGLHCCPKHTTDDCYPLDGEKNMEKYGRMIDQREHYVCGVP